MSDDEKDLRERVMAARVFISQWMSRQRRANKTLESVIRRLEILKAQNELALHSAWSSAHNLDGILRELDDRLDAERNSKN